MKEKVLEKMVSKPEGILSRRKIYADWAFGLVALVLAYAQNIPLSLIEIMVQCWWYQFSIAEKFLSFTFVWLGNHEAYGWWTRTVLYSHFA